MTVKQELYFFNHQEVVSFAELSMRQGEPKDFLRNTGTAQGRNVFYHCIMSICPYSLWLLNLDTATLTFFTFFVVLLHLSRC